MNRSTKVSAPLRLTTEYQTVLTAFPQGLLRITLVHVVNTSGGPQTVDVCYVPPATAPGAENALLHAYEIPANDYIELGQDDYLSPNVSIQARASADDAVNIRVAGIQE